MKICLFNGMNEDSKIEAFIIRHINNHEVNHLKFRDMNIKYCKSCGACAKLKKCVQKDDGYKIIEGYKESDVIIFLTPIIYGAYSKELKKALDRTMPIGETELSSKDGYMTHKITYNNKKVIILGILDEEDKEQEDSFNELLKANYYNMDWKFYKKAIIYRNSNENEINNKIEVVFKEVMDCE